MRHAPRFTHHLSCSYLVILFLLLYLPQADAIWNSLETEHFRIFYVEAVEPAQHLSRMCEQFYREAVVSLGTISQEPRIDVWLSESQEHFRTTVDAPIQDWAAACAYPAERRIVVQRPGLLSPMKLNFDTIVKHEIVHVIFGQRALPALNSVPRWFSEGMAMYLSEEWDMTHRWRMLGNSFWKRLIPLESLRTQFPESTPQAQLAYTQSLAAVSAIAQQGGPFALRSIMDLLAVGYAFDDALIQIIHVNLDNFEEQWLHDTQRQYHWFLLLSSSFPFWGSISAVVILAYYRRRRKQRAALDRWREEEAQVDPFFR